MIVADAYANPFWAETNRVLMNKYEIGRELIETAISQPVTAQNSLESAHQSPRSLHADTSESHGQATKPHPTAANPQVKIEKTESRKAALKKSEKEPSAKVTAPGAESTPAPARAPSRVPPAYRVADLRGTAPMPAVKTFWCRMCNSPEFDPKYLDSKMPTHLDFSSGTNEPMPLGIYIVIAFTALAILSLPFWWMFIRLGDNFFLLNIGPTLITLTFGSAILSVVYWRALRELEAGWKRYATAIYEKADRTTIQASYFARGGRNEQLIKLTYPDQSWELVRVRQSSDLIFNLNVVDSVQMARDSSEDSSVVVLQRGGHRIWCTPLIQASRS